jgi:hypothetical protein
VISTTQTARVRSMRPSYQAAGRLPHPQADEAAGRGNVTRQ